MRSRLLLLMLFLAYVSLALATGWLQIILALTTALIAFILLPKYPLKGG